MTHKDYCSEVCKAGCCRARDPFVTPVRCPMLNDKTNLCRIYGRRLGFTFIGETHDGRSHHCKCLPIKEALPHFPPDLRAKCCYEHPELLDADAPTKG